MDNNNYFSRASFREIFKRGFALAISKFGHFFLVLLISTIILYIINNAIITSNIAITILNFGYVSISQLIFLIIYGSLSLITGMIGTGWFVHLMGTVVIGENINIMKSLKFSIGKIGRWIESLGIIIVVTIAFSIGIFTLNFFMSALFQGFTSIIFIIIIFTILIIFLKTLLRILPIIYMLVPVMIIENLSVTEAISRTSQLLKETSYSKAIGLFLLLILANGFIIGLIILISGFYTSIGNNIQNTRIIIQETMKTIASFSISSAALNVMGIIFSIAVTAVSVVITTSALSQTTDNKEDLINRIRVNLDFPSRNPVNTDTTHNEES